MSRDVAEGRLIILIVNALSHETVLISTAECPVPLSNGFFFTRAGAVLSRSSGAVSKRLKISSKLFHHMITNREGY